MAGIEDLIGALAGRLGGTLSGASPFGGALDRLGGLSPFASGGPLSGRSPFQGGLSAPSPFRGGFNVESPFSGRSFNVQSPFQGVLSTGSPFSPFTLSSQGVFNPYTYKPQSNIPQGADSGGLAGTPSAGMDPNVARWADRMRSTFADLDPDLPDVMLAIVTNESHGDPNVQNAQGQPAYGLFQLWQQPGLDVDQQFAAAKKLAAEKLQGIRDAYAKNGLNPDQRTRALDFALAWAGHFDYNTGRANPNSTDIGSGQTAAELSGIFLRNYDAIKSGRSQQAAGPVANNGEYYFPVVGYTGQVQLHHGSEKGATDIMAPRGSTIVAMHSGTVTYVGYDDLGGWNVMIQGSDGKQYYYAHMDRQPEVTQGMVVRGGSRLGVVGDTGNAKGTGTHLHIGVGTHIISGAGPQGGAGDDFDLVTFLNNLQGSRR